MDKTKLLTAILVVLLVVTGAASWYIFRNNAGLSSADADQYQAGNTEISSPVESLDIGWTSGKVDIEYHAGTGIKVTETASRDLSEDEKLRWWLDGSTLRIRYIKSGINVTFNLNKSLTVSLPEGTTLKKATVSVTSADVNVPVLTADEIFFDSTSGDIAAVTETQRLNASSTSGNMRIQQNGDLDSAALTSTSGGISLTLAGAKNLEVRSTSGSIYVTASGAVGNVRLHSTSGSVVPDLMDTDNADFTSTSGEITAKLLSFRDLKINTTSGDVTLKLPEPPGFTCRIGSKLTRFSSELSMETSGNTCTFGDGSASCAVSTSSGSIRITK